MADSTALAWARVVQVWSPRDCTRTADSSNLHQPLSSNTCLGQGGAGLVLQGLHPRALDGLQGLDGGLQKEGGEGRGGATGRATRGQAVGLRLGRRGDRRSVQASTSSEPGRCWLMA